MINAWVEGVQEPSRELQMAGANTGCNRGLLGNEGGSPSRHRIRRAQNAPPCTLPYRSGQSCTCPADTAPSSRTTSPVSLSKDDSAFPGSLAREVLRSSPGARCRRVPWVPSSDLATVLPLLPSRRTHPLRTRTVGNSSCATYSLLLFPKQLLLASPYHRRGLGGGSSRSQWTTMLGEEDPIWPLLTPR